MGGSGTCASSRFRLCYLALVRAAGRGPEGSSASCSEAAVPECPTLGLLPFYHKIMQESGHDPYKQQRIKLGGLAEHLETIRRWGQGQ